MVSLSPQENQLVRIRGDGVQVTRATFFGGNAASTSTKTVADLKLGEISPETIRDVVEKAGGGCMLPLGMASDYV